MSSWNERDALGGKFTADYKMSPIEMQQAEFQWKFIQFRGTLTNFPNLRYVTELTQPYQEVRSLGKTAWLDHTVNVESMIKFALLVMDLCSSKWQGYSADIPLERHCHPCTYGVYSIPFHYLADPDTRTRLQKRKNTFIYLWSSVENVTVSQALAEISFHFLCVLVSFSSISLYLSSGIDSFHLLCLLL